LLLHYSATGCSKTEKKQDWEQNKRFSTCAMCFTAYCSRDCQKADFKTHHKAWCKAHASEQQRVKWLRDTLESNPETVFERRFNNLPIQARVLLSAFSEPH